MTIGLITLASVGVGGFAAHVRLVSDHQVEIEMSGTTRSYKNYGDIPLVYRQALEAVGQASTVENHLSCAVS